MLASLLLTLAALAARQPVDAPALCAAADLVVVAEVTGLEARWSQPRPAGAPGATLPGGIETVADLWVESVLRGQAPADLRVVVPGGRLAGLSQQVSEQAELRTDHRYLLLLRPLAGGEHLVVGGADGAWPLGHDPASLAAALSRLEGCRAP